MNRAFPATLFVAVLGALIGCAPPAAKVDERFVPKPELSAVALTRGALDQLAQGRYIEAEEGFRRALYLFPHADNVRRNLAAALLQGGQPEAAEAEYRAVIASNGDAPPLMNNLAQAVLQQGRFGEAIAIYESMYTRARDRGDLTVQIGTALSLSTIYFKLGREEEALCMVEEAFRARPDAETARRYGSLLLALNQPDRAIAVVDPLLAAHGPDPALLTVRAFASFARGDLADAEGAASRALEISTGDQSLVERELKLLKALAQNPTAPANPETKALAEAFGGPTPRWLYLPPKLLSAVNVARQSDNG